MEYCHKCGKNIDTDFDLDHDVEHLEKEEDLKDDIIKFRMVPWDKHGNKPKAEDVIKKKAREWVKKVDDEVYKTLTEKKLR